MKNDKSTKLFLVFAGIGFLLLSIYLIVISYAIANYKLFSGDKLRILPSLKAFMELFTSKKQLMTYFYLEVCNICMFALIIYSKLRQPDKFKSDKVEITPKIIIPKPAGEGQFGTAWFMSERNKDKVFKYNIIDLNNEKIKKLIEDGDIDIKEKIKKIDNGASLSEIEIEIKNEKKEEINKQKIEEEQRIYNEIFVDTKKYIDDNDLNENIINDNIIDIINLNEVIDIDDIEEGIEEENDYILNKFVEEIERTNKEQLKKEKSYNPNEDENKIFKESGIVVGVYKISDDKVKVYYIDSDTHSLTIGSTRSGKTRCLVLQTVIFTMLAGESLILSDPKGEIYAYTHKIAESLGYEIICLNFKNAEFSSHYNLLQPIINAKNDRTEEHPNGDIELMTNYAEELADMMIKETKGENPMWTMNAKAMLTGSILALTLLNDDEDLMNVSNVFRFIMNGEAHTICQEKDDMYMLIKALQEYQTDNPIINAMLTAINAAPETRTGFTVNAGAATRLFTQPSMWEITHKSNVDITKMGERKQILYFILPDEDTKYYKIASIIVKQIYNSLCKIADNKYGGRLPIRVNFDLDEFGNFTPVPNFDTELTVAGSRGIRFNLFIQGFPQITQKYDKETTEIVKSNCETWIYLKSNDNATPDEISKKLGSYTIYSNSESISTQNNTTTSSSSSQSLQKRNLLLPEEVKLLNRPYMLVMYGNNEPAINKSPDISQVVFNDMCGMHNTGNMEYDKQYNTNLRFIRDRQRKNTKTNDKMKYWDIFTKIKQKCDEEIDRFSDMTGRIYDEPRRITEEEYIYKIQEYLKEIEENKEIYNYEQNN